MLQRLKEAFSQRRKNEVFQRRKRRVVGADVKVAAVLVPLFYKEGEYYILFTERTDTVRDHKGQISFPGGANEIEDMTLLDTALRECKEEIGLDAGVVEVLGELDEMLTLHTNYLVSPFVGILPWPYRFRIDPKEVKQLIEAPISALLDKNNLYHETETVNDKLITGYYYKYKGKIIWGATARILTQFLDIYSQVMRDGEE